MKKYYFPDDEHMNDFFGGFSAVCVDRAELKRLAAEWEMSLSALLAQVHVASADEIETYGVYDS